MARKHTIIAALILLSMIPGCITQVRYNKKISRTLQCLPNQEPAPCACSDDTPPITIWIHGTKLSKRIVPFFAFCKPGLHHYSQTPKKYYLRTIAQTLIDYHPEQFPADTFYLFGWSGDLSHNARLAAAQKLYNELKVVIKEYKQMYGAQPRVQIITHSHGGNVALLLAQFKHPQEDFCIDPLILLACPVQVKTKALVTDPLFERVYSLYSCSDILQVLDPQGIQHEQAPLFSQRIFDCDNEKLVQVQLKLNGSPLSHLGFILKRFLCHLGKIVADIDQWHTHDTSRHQDWHEVEKVLHLNTKTK